MFSRYLKAVLAVALLAAACGRKEPPQPPPSKIPAPIKDLSIQQRGQEILLRMTYPGVTLGGLPIDSLETIEIYQMARILSSIVDSELEDESADIEEEPAAVDMEPEAADEADTEEPETSLFSLPETVTKELEELSKEALITVTDKDFAVTAESVWTLRGPELDAAIFGDKVVIRLPIAAAPDDFTEESILVFGARSIASGRRISPFSNLVKLLPRTPPAPPGNITVEATPLGVQIDWEPNGEEKGFRIYRRNANARDYGEPLSVASDQTASYLDRSAEFGRRYIYTVTSVSLQQPLVESPISSEHEVNYEDRFPPSAPREVVALAEPGRVRLLWEASTSEDTQGYWIYRQDPGAEFVPINDELVLGSEYLDSELASGSLYRYYILAIDGRGNQSAASEEIEVRVP